MARILRQGILLLNKPAKKKNATSTSTDIYPNDSYIGF